MHQFKMANINPNHLGCVQNRIQIGGFGTVRVNRADDRNRMAKRDSPALTSVDDDNYYEYDIDGLRAELERENDLQ